MAAEVQYKPIPRFPDYEASSDGEIRRISATRTRPAHYVLKAKTDVHGYLSVCLYRDGVPHHRQVHRLVCLAFYGDPQPEMQAAHINGIRKDCRAQNLRWATAKENAADRSLHGRWKPRSGERHHNANLTDEIVRSMRLRKSSGEQMKKIASEFGVSYLTAYDAIKGITWKHVK